MGLLVAPGAAPGPGEFLLVFACGPQGDPATVLRATDGAGSPQPEDVASAYFDGPSQEEGKAGIYAPLGDTLAGWAFTASESNGVVTIDLQAGAARQIGAMGSTQGALLEFGVRETLLAATQSQQLVLSENGACEPIWLTAGMSCPEMTRSGS